MEYFYVIIIPILIFTCNYLLRKIKPKSFSDYISFTAKTFPYLLGYAILIYFLEIKNVIKTGWVFLGLELLWGPLYFISFLLLGIFFVRNSIKENKEENTHYRNNMPNRKVE